MGKNDLGLYAWKCRMIIKNNFTICLLNYILSMVILTACKQQSHQEVPVMQEESLVMTQEVVHKCGLHLEKDSGLVYCNVDSQRIVFNDVYLDDGAMAMMLYPKGRYAYVVGDIVTNSNGWTVRYHLYRLDTQTLKTKHIGNFAAIHFEDDGFKAATTRLTNPNATCTADEVFAIHDVYFNYEGQQIRESNREYRYDEMERIYSDSLVNADGYRY